jgi:hypothetical protein
MGFLVLNRNCLELFVRHPMRRIDCWTAWRQLLYYSLFALYFWLLQLSLGMGHLLTRVTNRLFVSSYRKNLWRKILDLRNDTQIFEILIYFNLAEIEAWRHNGIVDLRSLLNNFLADLSQRQGHLAIKLNQYLFNDFCKIAHGFLRLLLNLRKALTL